MFHVLCTENEETVDRGCFTQIYVQRLAPWVDGAVPEAEAFSLHLLI